MIRSIERVWRHWSGRSVVPAMMLVYVVSAPTDPNRKNPGYGGVLPVPAPTASSNTTARPEATVDQHRDQRAARGRVLYASGRAPQTTTVPRPETKVPCERRVVQGKAPAPSPNS